MPPQANSALPAGFQLDQYRIERQLSLGGFSIVYLASDAVGTPVAIKEYLPNTLHLRSGDAIRVQVPEEHRLTFRYGMKCFFEEGRALVRLRHPNVVRVLNFFRANGTVYMVMQFERGRTLHDYAQQQRGGISENFLRAVFVRLLNGLREVHASKLLHLDIKPSNIYLRTDGTPVLLDFGASRQTLLAERPILKPMFTPGFASPEHYERRDRLGPWSDIYGVGASLYACVTGKAPQRADQRVQKDTLQPVAQSHGGRYSAHLLELIDWCLQLDPAARPHSVYALQKALGRAVQKPPPAVREPQSSADAAAPAIADPAPAASGSGFGARLRALFGRS